MILLQAHEVTSTDIYGAAFIALLGYAVQWGIMRQRIIDLKDDVVNLKGEIAELKKTVQDRILPRQEYENRHKDLQNRVGTLEETAFLRARRFERESGH